MEIIKNPNFDFLGRARYFIAASLVLILAGAGHMATRGLRYGVEFSGGLQLIVKFQKPPAIDKVRDAVSAVAPGATLQTYDNPAKNQVLVRLAGELKADVDEAGRSVLSALAAGYPDNVVLESSSEVVGPVVGAELRRKAVQLTVLGLVFQLVYIAIRFKGAIWGTAAVVAVLHDVLVTLGFLAFFGYELTLNVIAALLTLVGYSVNDTIVIFDRARENLRQKRKGTMQQILNDSVNQTLTRTLLSNGTTFLAVLGLYLFGGEVLRGFGFTMVVGVIVGTYSTVFIASPIVAWWARYQASRRSGAGSAKGAA
jgi:preprotein translocase subunit SecF